MLTKLAILQEIIPQKTIINQRFCDLITRLLHFDPAQRLDVRGALAHPFFQLQMCVLPSSLRPDASHPDPDVLIPLQSAGMRVFISAVRSTTHPLYTSQPRC